MQENNFEKNVRQKMEELLLYPSAELWPEVERRIRKERKRRWIIFWSLLLLFLAGSGVAVYFLNKEDEKIATHQQVQQQPGPAFQENSKNDRVIKDQLTEKATPSPGTDNRIKIVAGANENKNTIPVEIVNNKNPDTSFENGGGGKKKITSFHKSEKPLPLFMKKEKSVIPEYADEGQYPIMEVTKKDGAVKRIQEPLSILPEKSHVQSNETKPENKTEQTDPDKPVVSTPDAAASSEKPVSVIKKNKKGWETGITFSTGLSNRVGGLSIFGANKNLDANPFLAGGPGLGAPQLYKPADSRSGLYVETGIYAQKQLKKKTAYSIEFLVSSFHVRQPTGSFADSVQGLSSADANRYYRTGNSSVYNSRYYYLQLPLMFHWQLNKNSKLSLVWQNGLSPSLLLGSNALVFNRPAGLLYRNYPSFNKLQLSFRSGLYAQFGAGSTKSFSAGLIIDYQLTRLQRNSAFDKNHLSSFGIQVRKTLKK